MAKITFNLSDEVAAAVKKFAEKKQIDMDAAGEKLISTGISRLGALARYAKTHPPAGKAEPKPKAKKAKAKGPIARKQKGGFPVATAAAA